MHKQLIRAISKSIQGYQYLADRELLLIAFKSGVYAYENVPHAVWADFVKAPSKGQFFSRSIQNIYETAKLTEAQVFSVLGPEDPPVKKSEWSLQQLALKYPILNALF